VSVLVLLQGGDQLRLNRLVESVGPTTADPVVAARSLASLTRAAPELVGATARHLHLLFELAAELAARIGPAAVPESLRADVPSSSSSTLTVARRRLAGIASQGPERYDAAIAALQTLLDRLG
jgi:hypothetical protein